MSGSETQSYLLAAVDMDPKRANQSNRVGAMLAVKSSGVGKNSVDRWKTFTRSHLEQRNRSTTRFPGNG